MNTVWNSYGQLLQLPEKTSKKMQIFCRGLDIRVPQIRRHFCVPFLFYGNYPPPPLILPTKTFTIRLNITAFAERK